ncbi:DUF2087 domain-containing protein [Deinococcus radiopugnans]|uniref:DUF2087 domain-containing protein n=1 Tax=Deinococcus radiopugnans ATCC 19172 TaxID=585398 RepID=A0A5C4Y8J1_9DEIO|nr:DUF2087 domain-containing protein [Deinococcus radiopugnans]MBB6016241.1 hypothetical protein [Deinococcus radiopugnans ATCC 19172]QLG10094.1 DUF2087 domain-containing protein [Deinococcus sp. D7000]TNM72254.1 DUF2087 domain-containing protein [Deinococcus radiopugnans ATCC 19172]
MTKSINDFQDDYGRITAWPSKRRRAHQMAILDYLTGLFEPGVSYDQGQVERILADHSTLEDPSVLLTELLDSEYLTTADGAYWRADGRPGVSAGAAEPSSGPETSVSKNG